MCVDEIFQRHRNINHAARVRATNEENKKHKSCLQLLQRIQELVNHPIEYNGYLDTFCLGEKHVHMLQLVLNYRTL